MLSYPRNHLSVVCQNNHCFCEITFMYLSFETYFFVMQLPDDCRRRSTRTWWLQTSFNKDLMTPDVVQQEPDDSRRRSTRTWWLQTSFNKDLMTPDVFQQGPDDSIRRSARTWWLQTSFNNDVEHPSALAILAPIVPIWCFDMLMKNISHMQVLINLVYEYYIS